MRCFTGIRDDTIETTENHGTTFSTTPAEFRGPELQRQCGEFPRASDRVGHVDPLKISITRLLFPRFELSMLKCGVRFELTLYLTFL
jgi:hypothetical protein